MVVGGDLRFISHLDSIRAIERTAARAGVPLRFTQGFNPHPIFALLCPRPVGVATLDDPVMLDLAKPASRDDLLEAMNSDAPSGMRFHRAEPLTAPRTPRVRKVLYRLNLDAQLRREVQARLDELLQAATWPAERVKPSRKRGRPPKKRTIDLKTLVKSIAVDDSAMFWTNRPAGDMWARVEEVLNLVGLNGRDKLADVVRTNVDCET